MIFLEQGKEMNFQVNASEHKRVRSAGVALTLTSPAQPEIIPCKERDPELPLLGSCSRKQLFAWNVIQPRSSPYAAEMISQTRSRGQEGKTHLRSPGNTGFRPLFWEWGLGSGLGKPQLLQWGDQAQISQENHFLPINLQFVLFLL